MIKSKLKNVLNDRKMTQLQLVEKTGVRQPTISALANDTLKRIPLDVLDRICEVLDCDVSDVLEYKKER